MVEHPKDIKFSGQVFIQENSGNIKDFYKITSCIGRGKYFQIPFAGGNNNMK